MSCSAASPTPTRTSSCRRWPSSSSKSICCSSSPPRSGSAAWSGSPLPAQARPWRFVAFTYLLFLAMMMAMHAKDYYVAPIYPVLFAAGAVAFGQLTRRSWPLIVYTVDSSSCSAVVTGPIVLTILPPDRYNAYTARFGRQQASDRKSSPARCRNILSDRFGWPQMVAGLCRALQRSAARRARPHRHLLRQLRRGQRGQHSGPQIRPAHRHQRPSKLLLLGMERLHRRIRSHPRQRSQGLRRQLRAKSSIWAPSTRPGSWTTSITTTSGCATASAPTPPTGRSSSSGTDRLRAPILAAFLFFRLRGP